MLEKQKQPETCIITTSCSNVVQMWWDIWPELYYKFTAEFGLKEIFKSVNIWQRYGEKLIASSALCAWVLLKDEELA